MCQLLQLLPSHVLHRYFLYFYVLKLLSGLPQASHFTNDFAYAAVADCCFGFGIPPPYGDYRCTVTVTVTFVVNNYATIDLSALCDIFPSTFQLCIPFLRKSARILVIPDMHLSNSTTSDHFVKRTV